MGILDKVKKTVGSADDALLKAAKDAWQTDIYNRRGFFRSRKYRPDPNALFGLRTEGQDLSDPLAALLTGMDFSRQRVGMPIARMVPGASAKEQEIISYFLDPLNYAIGAGLAFKAAQGSRLGVMGARAAGPSFLSRLGQSAAIDAIGTGGFVAGSEAGEKVAGPEGRLIGGLLGGFGAGSMAASRLNAPAQWDRYNPRLVEETERGTSIRRGPRAQHILTLPNRDEVDQLVKDGLESQDWYDLRAYMDEHLIPGAPVGRGGRYMAEEGDDAVLAGLIASTSMNTGVSPNVDNAIQIYNKWLDYGRNTDTFIADVAAGKAGARIKSLVSKRERPFGSQLDHVETILRGHNAGLRGYDLIDAMPSRRKVHQFARSLYGDPDAVVLDVHVGRGLGILDDRVRKSILQNDTTYHELAQWVRDGAVRFNELNGTQLTPAQYQAALWGGSRKKWGMETDSLIRELDADDNLTLDAINAYATRLDEASHRSIADVVAEARRLNDQYPELYRALGDSGAIKLAFQMQAATTGLGAAIGAASGDTTEERVRNALIGAGIVTGVGVGGTKLADGAFRKPVAKGSIRLYHVTEGETADTILKTGPDPDKVLWGSLEPQMADYGGATPTSVAFDVPEKDIIRVSEMDAYRGGEGDILDYAARPAFFEEAKRKKKAAILVDKYMGGSELETPQYVLVDRNKATFHTPNPRPIKMPGREITEVEDAGRAFRNIEQSQAEGKRPWNFSEQTPEGVAANRTFETAGGKAGFMLTPDGDLQNVYNNSSQRGLGPELVRRAVEEGAITLDNYDGFLTDLYKSEGFVETGRMKFNPEYAPDNMPQEVIDAAPDVVFMARGPYDGEVKYWDDWDAAKEHSRQVGQANVNGEAQSAAEAVGITRKLNEEVGRIKAQAVRDASMGKVTEGLEEAAQDIQVKAAAAAEIASRTAPRIPKKKFDQFVGRAADGTPELRHVVDPVRALSELLSWRVGGSAWEKAGPLKPLVRLISPTSVAKATSQDATTASYYTQLVAANQATELAYTQLSGGQAALKLNARHLDDVVPGVKPVHGLKPTLRNIVERPEEFKKFLSPQQYELIQAARSSQQRVKDWATSMLKDAGMTDREVNNILKNTELSYGQGYWPRVAAEVRGKPVKMSARKGAKQSNVSFQRVLDEPSAHVQFTGDMGMALKVYADELFSIVQMHTLVIPWAKKNAIDIDTLVPPSFFTKLDQAKGREALLGRAKILVRDVSKGEDPKRALNRLHKLLSHPQMTDEIASSLIALEPGLRQADIFRGAGVTSGGHRVIRDSAPMKGAKAAQKAAGKAVTQAARSQEATVGALVKLPGLKGSYHVIPDPPDIQLSSNAWDFYTREGGGYLDDIQLTPAGEELLKNSDVSDVKWVARKRKAAKRKTGTPEAVVEFAEEGRIIGRGGDKVLVYTGPLKGHTDVTAVREAMKLTAPVEEALTRAEETVGLLLDDKALKRWIRDLATGVKDDLTAYSPQVRADTQYAEDALKAARNSVRMGYKQVRPEVFGGALGGKVFEEHWADQMNRSWEKAQPTKGALKAVNDWTAIQVAAQMGSFDAGFTLLQGASSLPMLPWIIKNAVTDGNYAARLNNLSRQSFRDGVDKLTTMAAYGLMVGDEALNPQMVLGSAGKGVSAKAAEFIQHWPTNKLFSRYIGMARMELFDKQVRLLEGIKGRALTPDEYRTVARVANTVSGGFNWQAAGVSHGQRAAERIGLRVAPTWLRANMAWLAAAAQPNMSLEANLARGLLATTTATLVGSYAAATMAMGQTPNLDPRDPNFLTARINDQRVGLPGVVVSIARTMGKAVELGERAAEGDEDARKQLLDIREGKNPIRQFWRGGAPFIGGLVYDTVTQQRQSYTQTPLTLDDPLTTGQAIGESLLPPSIQSYMQDGPTGFWSTSAGLRQFPISAPELFQEGADRKAQELGYQRWADVPKATQAEVLRRDTDLQDLAAAKDSYFAQFKTQQSKEDFVFGEIDKSRAGMEDFLLTNWQAVQEGRLELSEFRQRWSELSAKHAYLSNQMMDGLDTELGKKTETEPDYYARMYQAIQPDQFDSDADGIISENEWALWRVAKDSFWTQFPEAQKHKDYIELEYPNRFWSSEEMVQVSQLKKEVQNRYDEFLRIPKYRGLTLEDGQFIDEVKGLADRGRKEIRVALSQRLSPEQMARISIPDSIAWKYALKQLSGAQFDDRQRQLIQLAIKMDTKQGLMRQMLDSRRIQYLMGNKDLLAWYPAAIRDTGLRDEDAGRLGLLSTPQGESVQQRGAALTS